MITGDLDRALQTPVSTVGTWRPPPPGSHAAPGAYATTVAFLLARHGGYDAPTIAARLAGKLRPLPWVSAATVTGGGYLTITVTPEALARLAVRIAEAGPGCAHSDALAGTVLSAPVAVGLVTARTWEEARECLAGPVIGRLAEAAGATVTFHDTERHSPAPDSPVAEAITFAGLDAVVFALASLPPHGPARLDRHLIAAPDLGNPAYAVRYAHAHAASILRQAGDLGFDWADAAGFQPRLLAHPSELALLYELSWLPERLAGAARRRRPDVLARFLAGLAQEHLTCQALCPAIRPGADPAGPVTVARLWLAAASQTALGTGLGLLGVTAPEQM